MILFRMLLILMLLVLALYTAQVIADHGWNLLPVFFGDIAKMAWPGQFNMDFTGFLILSALWTAWRHGCSPVGLLLAVPALFGGIMFLASYLLIVSFLVKGSVFLSKGM